MTTIVVLGGTGYTGANIVAEAVRRGHTVTSWSRTLPAEPVDGVRYETGDLLDPATLASAVSGADIIVGALSPRGELAGKQRALYGSVAELAAAQGSRWAVVGGFSSLRLAEGAPRIAAGDEVPPQFADEARELAAVADDLLDSDSDWIFVSPAGTYGSYAPGEKLGAYRVGGDVAIFDADGNSAISGADYATAFVDELEKGEHRRAQVNFAY